jgi:hypothetical protein
MMNLDDALIFRPLFEEILSTVALLGDMPDPTIQALVDTQITQCLQTLRDLCFVILEFIKNEEARQIIRFVSELINKWRSKKQVVLFEPRPENKIAIRNKLSHLYLSAVKDQQSLPQL